MRRTARWTPGLALVGGLALAGCGGDEPAPAESAGQAQTPPGAAPTGAKTESAETLRITAPDPEALGIEGTLPPDVPVPEGARAVHPPLVAAGTMRASFESDEPLAALQAFYKARLAESGWSIHAEKTLDSQVLMSANKDGRELSVAMSAGGGPTQFVLLIVGE